MVSLLYDNIFHKLHKKCIVTFDNTLKVTAGKCLLYKNICHIKLSFFVCSNEKIIKNILLHEMCHAAVMLIDKDIKEIHGKKFHKWGKKAQDKCGEIVTTYHNFPVDRNFKYKCQNCGNIKKVCKKNYASENCICRKCLNGKYIQL